MLLAALLPAGAAAQTPYDRAVQQNLWNDGRNIAGLRTADTTLAEYGTRPRWRAVSYAELGGRYRQGGFKDLHEGRSSWQAGAVTKTEVHAGKTSMIGAFSFDQTQAQEACGPMFIEPGKWPFDLLEFTPGGRTLQQYAFSGGIARDLSDRWTLGSCTDFRSANYAKRKDLRHTNYALDLTVTPSLLFRPGRRVRLGLSGILGKSTESVKAEQIGSANTESYYAFLDKGLMYGSYEVWNGSGVHLDEAGVNRFPVTQYRYGGAFQLGWKDLYADVEYLRSEGTVGEKGYTWFRFPGQAWTAQLGYKAVRPGGTHLFRLQYVWKQQILDESVWDKVTEGGITTPQVYDANRVFERRRMAVAPSWQYIGKNRFEMRVVAELSWWKERSSLVYPYTDTDGFGLLDTKADLTWHLGPVDLGLAVRWFDPILTDTEKTIELLLPDPLAPSRAYRLTDWYHLRYEYRTAGRIGGDVRIRWNFSVGQVRNLYAEAAGSYLRALSFAYAEGPDRLGGGLKLGYNF